MGYPSQKVAKPQCPKEQEERGGSHSWWVRCDRVAGHSGACGFNLSTKEKLVEGTYVYDVASQVSMRKDAIIKLNAQLDMLEEEIVNLRLYGTPEEPK